MACNIVKLSLPHCDGACFVDTVTETVFGPVFDDTEEAESFSEWLYDFPGNEIVGYVDPRQFTPEELNKYLGEFRELREEEGIITEQNSNYHNDVAGSLPR